MLNKIKQISEKIKIDRDSKKTNDQYIVGLDIGTEFVKALIAKINGNKLEIVGVGKSHQQLTDMQAGAIADIAGVVANCDEALNQAEQQANVSARTAVIGIAGELVKGTTTTIKCTRKNSTKPLDAEEFSQIVNLVQERAEQKAKQSLEWELGGKTIEIKLVNSAIVNIDIDGYLVTNPIGFQGKEILIQLYTAFAPLIHIGALDKTAQELDLDLLAVAAEPFAVARSIIGDDPNANTSAILMDIGGGTTDIAVINEGGVQGTQMFGIGGRAFTKSIERELDVSFASAEKLKLAISSNNLSEKFKKGVISAVTQTTDVWESGIELALAEFDKLDHLPNTVLLCGGGASLDLIVDRLEEGDWYKDLPFTKRPKIHYIHPSDVSGIIDSTGEVNDHTYITAMGLLRVGMDTLFQQGNKGPISLRDKLERALKK
ncbi:MAG TPA: cell division FtsA domain-containing protein [Candidatus Dormibacteraeota bacterium]|nr:cell division FtsA domain-containing protein [Candidatus Dormibacteraeota bacterium]